MVNGVQITPTPGGKHQTYTEAERGGFETNWVSKLCITSDSSDDDFFPVDGHPVTMPAHDQKQKCGLADLGLHTQTQIKWTNHTLIGSTVIGNTYKTRSFI